MLSVTFCKNQKCVITKFPTSTLNKLIIYRLFVNGLPKDKSQQEIQQAMSEVSEDVSDVIVHPGSNPGKIIMFYYSFTYGFGV